MPRRRCYNPTASHQINYFQGPLLASIPPALIPPNIPLLSELIRIPVTKAECDTFLSQYETFILSILQQIIDRVSLDSILESLQAIQPEINSRAQAEEVIATIETLILSIIDNITNRVSLDIVLNRIAYLKTKLEEAPCLPSVYIEVGELLLYAIDLVTNKESLDTVLSGLLVIQANLTANVEVANHILQIHSLIISIIQNIIDRVSFDIILNRIQYLKTLMLQAERATAPAPATGGGSFTAPSLPTAPDPTLSHSAAATGYSQAICNCGKTHTSACS